MLLIIHWLLYNDYLYTYLHLQFWHSRRSRIHKQPPEVFLKFFANFTGKHLCWSLFFTKLQAFRPATLLKKTPTQVFSCEICDILKNTCFEEHRNDCFCVLTTSSYIDFYRATSKTWIRTLDPEPRPWKTWTQKNMGNSWIWKIIRRPHINNLLTLKIC